MTRTKGAFTRYAVVGALGALVNIGAFSILTASGLWYLAASVCAFLLRSITRYVLFKAWVFRTARSRVRLHLVVEIGNLLLGTAFLAAFVELLGVPELPALVLTILLLYGLGFLLARRVFRGEEREGA